MYGEVGGGGGGMGGGGVFWTPHKTLRGLNVSEPFRASLSGVVLPVPGETKVCKPHFVKYHELLQVTLQGR